MPRVVQSKAKKGSVTTIFSGIPACFLFEIIAFAEKLGKWGLKSEVSPSQAGMGSNYFDSPLSLPGLCVTFGGPCLQLILSVRDVIVEQTATRLTEFRRRRREKTSTLSSHTYFQKSERERCRCKTVVAVVVAAEPLFRLSRKKSRERCAMRQKIEDFGNRP